MGSNISGPSTCRESGNGLSPHLSTPNNAINGSLLAPPPLFLFDRARPAIVEWFSGSHYSACQSCYACLCEEKKYEHLSFSTVIIALVHLGVLVVCRLQRCTRERDTGRWNMLPPNILCLPSAHFATLVKAGRSLSISVCARDTSS